VIGLLLIIAFHIYAIDMIYYNFWIKEKEESEEQDNLNNV